MFYGLQIVVAHTLIPFTVETNSMVLIALLSTGNTKYLHIFNACSSTLRELYIPEIEHTLREGNGVADSLAHSGKEPVATHLDVLFFENPPTFVRSHLLLTQREM